MMHKTLCRLVTLCVSCSVLPSQATRPSAPPAKQNVLILIADDLGVDGVACYGEGAEPAKTPNIDALAARGVLFRNAWAYPVCSPTRACLMTGRYGFRTGVGTLVRGGGQAAGRGGRFGGRRGGGQRGGGQRGRGRRRGDSKSPIASEFTLPKLLDAAESGYAHGKIGKWHLGGGASGPNDLGWSHFAGLLPGGLIGGSSYRDWPRTVDGETKTCKSYATEQHVDDALAFIMRSQAKQKPWVCVVSFIAPHWPYHYPPGSSAREGNGDGDVQKFRAMLEALDTEMGRLLRELGPQLANTNVIFMGDNGTDSQVTRAPFDPDRAKATLYEGGVNVPLIVAGPVVGGRPRESAALICAVDMYGTVAELCGVDAKSHYPQERWLDSISFVPHLRAAGGEPVRKTAYTEMFRGDPMRTGSAAIRDARFKVIRLFVRNGKARDRMYDLKNDPFERRNVLRRKQSGEILARYKQLSGELDRLRASRK